MTRVISVPVEPLTAEAFAPFGMLIEADQDDRVWDDNPTRTIDLGFSIDGEPAFFLYRYVRQQMEATELERHNAMTESRVALGRRTVIIVAEPNPASPAADLATVRAFLIGPHQGFVFKRGTWHSLDVYPVDFDTADFAFFTERESEAELAMGEIELAGDLSACVRTDVIDLIALADTKLAITDPNGYLAVGALQR